MIIVHTLPNITDYKMTDFEGIFVRKLQMFIIFIFFKPIISRDIKYN